MNPFEDYAFEVHAPVQPGTYYLRWDRSWEYGCVDMGVPIDARSLAAICVQ